MKVDLPTLVREIGRGLWLYDFLKLYSDPATGLVAEGRLITAEELAERLGCSASTIRHWIADLEFFGLLNVTHGRGCYVFSVRPDWMPEESAERWPREQAFPGTGAFAQ